MRKADKLMVIGIDGVPFELIKRFTAEGVMPCMQTLTEKYPLIRTQVPLPEVSSVSWTSFMTGMNPGLHGVYGFMEINRDKYSYTFPSFRNLPVKTIWEEAGIRGKQSVIINLPSTYPVRPMQGKMVSGFVALDLEKAVFPKKHYAMLEKMEYQVDVDTAVGKGDKTFFLRELQHTLNLRYELYKQWESMDPWDLFLFIITGTDRLHHFMFEAYQQENSPYYDAFRNYYKDVDRIIGQITLDMENRGIPFIILSDHGFTQLDYEVYLSQYLKKWGYLELETEQPRNLTGISTSSQVFALDPSRLYIHLEGKYSRGCVKESRYHELREELKNRFLGLEIEGVKVIKGVYFKEEIYETGSGENYLENAPDLVLLSNYGFDLKAGVTKTELYGRSYFTGMHSQDNAVLLDAVGLQLTTHPNIADVGNQLKNIVGNGCDLS